MNEFENAITDIFDPHTFIWRVYFAPETLGKPFGLKEAVEQFRKHDKADKEKLNK